MMTTETKIEDLEHINEQAKDIIELVIADIIKGTSLLRKEMEEVKTTTSKLLQDEVSSRNQQEHSQKLTTFKSMLFDVLKDYFLSDELVDSIQIIDLLDNMICIVNTLERLEGEVRKGE